MADDQLAHVFGYNPVFHRKYGTWSSLSFAFSVGACSPLVMTFAYPLQAGGPAAIVWCWFIAGAPRLSPCPPRCLNSSRATRPRLGFTTPFPVSHRPEWFPFSVGKILSSR